MFDHGSCCRSGMSNGWRSRATSAMMLLPFSGSFSTRGRSMSSPCTALVTRYSPFLSSRRKMPYWALVISSASCRMESRVSSRRRREEMSNPARRSWLSSSSLRTRSRLTSCEAAGVIDCHGCLVDKIIEHQLFELGELAFLVADKCIKCPPPVLATISGKQATALTPSAA